MRPAAATAAAADPVPRAALVSAAQAEAGDATPGVPLRDGRGSNAADLAAAVAAIVARRGSAPAARAARRSGGGGAEGGNSDVEDTCTSCGGSPGGEGDGAATPLMYRRVQLALGPRVAGCGGGAGAAGVSEHAAAAAALGLLQESEPTTPEPGRGSGSGGDEDCGGHGGAGERHRERGPAYGSGQGALAYLMAGSPASSVAQSVASSCVPSRAAAGLPTRPPAVQRAAAGAGGGVGARAAGPGTRPAVRKAQAASAGRAAASSRPRAAQQAAIAHQAEGVAAAATARPQSAAAAKRVAAVAAHKAVCTPASSTLAASPASSLASLGAKTRRRASLSARVAGGAGASAAAAGGAVGAIGHAPDAAVPARQPVPTATEAAATTLAHQRERAQDALARRLFRPAPVATARGAGGGAAASGSGHRATGGTVRPLAGSHGPGAGVSLGECRVAAGLAARTRSSAAVAQGGVSVGAGPGGAQPSCRRLRAVGARAALLGARLKREKARAEEGVEALRQQLQQEQERLQQQQQQQEVCGKEAGQGNTGAGTSGTAVGAFGESAVVQVGADLCRVDSEDSSAGCSSSSDWEGNTVAGAGRKRVGVGRERRDGGLQGGVHLPSEGLAYTRTGQEVHQEGGEEAEEEADNEQRRLARLWRGEAGEREEDSVQGSVDEDRGEGGGDGAEEGPVPLLLRWRPSRDGGGNMGFGGETLQEVVSGWEEGDVTEDELDRSGEGGEASGGNGEGGGSTARWGSLDVEMQVMARLEALLAERRGGQLPPPQAGAPQSAVSSPSSLRRPQRSYGAARAAEEEEEEGDGEQEIDEVNGQMVMVVRGVHEGAEWEAAAGQTTAPSHRCGDGELAAAVAEHNRMWATQLRGQQGRAKEHAGTGVRLGGSGTGPCKSSGAEARKGEGHGPVAESPAGGGSVDCGHAVAGAESEREGEKDGSGGEDEDSDWDGVDVLMQRALLRAAAAAAVPRPAPTDDPESPVMEEPAAPGGGHGGTSTRRPVLAEVRSGEAVPSAAHGRGQGGQQRAASRPAGIAGQCGGDGDVQSGGGGGEARGAGEHVSDTGGSGGGGGGSRPGSGKGRGAAAELRAEYLALKRAHVP